MSQEASRVRSFTAWIFSVLCFLLNEKCELDPKIERAWVGCWNSAEFVYTKAAKIEKFASTLLDIISASKITFSQAESLAGKISCFCQQNPSDPTLRILFSYFNTIVRLFNDDPTRHKASDTRSQNHTTKNPKSSDSYYISDAFIKWCSEFLTKLKSQLQLKSHPDPPTFDTKVIITCDASNIGGGLAIYHKNELIFETAQALPLPYMLDSNNADIESSSTDNERLIFLKLALQQSKEALSRRFPNSKIFADIRTDSLPLVFQSYGTSLKTPATILDIKSILDFLENWGIPYSINHHSREHILAKTADQNSRILFPKLTTHAATTLKTLMGKRKLKELDVSALILHTQDYISDTKFSVIYIPLNLTNSLYAQIFSKLPMIHHSNMLLVPKLKQQITTLLKNFKIKFTFPPSSFHNKFSHLLTATFVPYLLFEPTGKVTGDAWTRQALADATSRMQKYLASPSYQEQLHDMMREGAVGPDIRSADKWSHTKVPYTENWLD